MRKQTKKPTPTAPNLDERVTAIVLQASGVEHPDADDLTDELFDDLVAACEGWIAKHPQLDRTFFTAAEHAPPGFDAPGSVRAYLRCGFATLVYHLECDMEEDTCYTLTDAASTGAEAVRS